MKLSEIKKHLATANNVNFQLPNGTVVPEHFHVTEVGMVHKHYIDCGGTVRNEKVVSFQLWTADDTDHRLKSQKLLDIIALSEKTIGLEDAEVEVEYQNETISKYGLDFSNGTFLLTTKLTDCLAPDKCGVTEKKKVSLSELQNQSSSCCGPNSKCC